MSKSSRVFKKYENFSLQLLQASAAQEMRDKEAQVGDSKDHLAVLQFPGFVCRSRSGSRNCDLGCRRVEFLGR